jgi:hypothetical protein
MYTHTTIVQRMVQIPRQRLLPIAGEVIAIEGQEMSPVQVVARTPRDSDYYIMPASEQLGLDAAALVENLQVEPGAAVEQGTVLVRKRGFPRSKTLMSPVIGTFLAARNGRLILQQTPEWLELRAMVRGRVVRLVSSRGVELEVNGSLVEAIWGSGKEAYGHIRLAAHTSDAPLTSEMLESDTLGQVLVVGHLNDAELLHQAERADVRGIVTGSIRADLLAAATAVAFPVLVTDGIGQQRMAAPIFQLFLQADKQEVSLFGQTAPGQRPEIIIPVSGTAGASAGATMPPLAVGQAVRLLRAPHRNEVGEVVRLHERARTTAVLAQTYGADVQLPGGNVIFVPYANLDALI